MRVQGAVAEQVDRQRQQRHPVAGVHDRRPGETDDRVTVYGLEVSAVPGRETNGTAREDSTPSSRNIASAALRQPSLESSRGKRSASARRGSAIAYPASR